MIVEGVGMHSAGTCRIEIRALPRGDGRHLVIDGLRMVLDPRGLQSHRRCSEFQGIGPLEHLAAALLLSGWSDWDVSVQGNGIPLREGSAKDFCVERSEHGIPRLDVPGFEFHVTTRWGGHLSAKSSGRARILCRHGDELWSGEEYDLQECLTARTFIGIDALAEALEGGLLLGCTLEQGRILGPAVTAAGRALASRLGLDPNLQVLWGKARMAAETAAHKVLDLVGDLSLWIGALPVLDIEMEHVGHEQFHALGAALLPFVETRSMS